MNTRQIDQHTIDDIKAYDLRHYVEQRLGPPKSRSSKVWYWPCPLHHGSKPSFSVWENGWKCWADCGEGGDIIGFVQKLDCLDFHEAVTLLSGNLAGDSRPIPRPQALPRPTILQPPSQAYQQAALDIVERAQSHLWDNPGPALDYLVNKRGLLARTILTGKLGYIPPNKRGQWWIMNGLKFPGNAITIPWISGGDLWGIKFRWLDGENKYRYVQAVILDELYGSSNLAGSLYLADLVLPNWPVMYIEGEFNALTAWQEARDKVCPISLGTSGSSLNPRWFAQLATASKQYALYDKDSAGEKGAARLLGINRNIQLISLSEGIKDLNEYHVMSRQQQQQRVVTGWIESIVNA